MTAAEWVRENFAVIAERDDGFEVVDPQTGGPYFIPREDAEQAVA